MTRRRLALAVLVLALLVTGPAPTLAQSKMDAATAAAAEPAAAGTTTPEASQTEKGPEKPVITAMPSAPGNVVLSDPDTKQKYLEAMQRYYDYRANGYAYRSRVFEWQLFSSRLIFMVVLVLVGAGIYFAAIQFQSAMRVSRAKPVAGVQPAQVPTLATQLEVSAKGIIVNSSVMGVIILALSLAFFYLYLVYVYPITDVI